ncbi:hypothetical protein ROA7450_02966 [Roseovarius albus]|uniref:Glycosyl transferase family 2 n=2 Tax=Roseovarius albus TaxID=1247867 RepID=A0A1X6ZPC4_9RHOB|nr:hypothetical protein ROA7450_02966 [Roseovarius albus]
MWDTIHSIAPQVDRLFLCLNEYTEIPAALNRFPNVEPLIPDKDLMDAGKFAFPAEKDDVVFTIDDDIIYPKDYIERMLQFADKVDLEQNSIGYQAHAWVFKKRFGKHGWRNFLFGKECKKIIKVDVLGTGTVCAMGKNMPSLDDMITSAGFVDFRFSRHQIKCGVNMWTLPRDEGYVQGNLPDELWESSLFQTVNRQRAPGMQIEMRKLMQEVQPNAGRPWEKLQ